MACDGKLLRGQGLTGNLEVVITIRYPPTYGDPADTPGEGCLPRYSPYLYS